MDDKEARSMKCEDCRHFECGLTIIEISGVCLKRTDWEGKALAWRHFYDSPCGEFEPDTEEGK